MSLVNTLDKLLQLLKQKNAICADVEKITQRAVLEIGEMETTISELIHTIRTLERREDKLEGQILDLEERISELESLAPDVHDAS
jgi:phage shock protein A